MAIWPFQPSRASRDAAKLLETVTEVSRRREFFGPGRIPDTLQGRFELMALNAGLALLRLRENPGTAPLAQIFTDKLFRAFDAGLREDGVGDLAVAKRMRALASSFYGRLDAYAGALATRDRTALESALARNVFGVETHPYAGALADYVLTAFSRHAASPSEALIAAEAWPGPA